VFVDPTTISSIGYLVFSLTAFGVMLLLHRLKAPIAAFLEGASKRSSAKRLERLLRLPKKTRKLLAKPDSDNA